MIPPWKGVGRGLGQVRARHEAHGQAMEEQGGARPATWTLRVGRGLLGVPVSLHWSLLIAPVAFYLMWSLGDAKADIPVQHGRLLLIACVDVILLSFFVYLHEVAHALAGLRTRTPVPEIVLTPFGGAALMGQRMRSPNQEVVVSLAGPLVTLMLMGLFVAGYQFGLHERLSTWTNSPMAGSFYMWCLGVNVAMGLFNLVPMMPLDGGLAFRAMLSFRMNPVRATRIAAFVGQVLAVAMAGAGIYLWSSVGGIWPSLLVFVALWGFSACHQEKLYANEGLVYADGDYGMGEESESWRAGVKDPPKPGWFARWKERRRVAQAEREMQEEQAFRQRVDELLVKVKKEGMEALTKSERQLLEEASTRFRKGQSEGRRR